MHTKKHTSKPEDSPKQEAGEGCSGATCSALYSVGGDSDGVSISLLGNQEITLSEDMAAQMAEIIGKCLSPSRLLSLCSSLSSFSLSMSNTPEEPEPFLRSLDHDKP